MYNLPLQIPPDQFSDGQAALSCPNSQNITVSIFNAGIYYQLAVARLGVNSRQGGEAWAPDGLGAFLPPGVWNFSAADFNGGYCHAIRFRNAVAGLAVPATVTATA